MNKRIATIVGARPQFIKAAAVSRAIRNFSSAELTDTLIHTGQHYDENMSKVFFDELEIPRPAYNLEISGGRHGAMTGRMLEAIEEVLLAEKPECVLVYGDTNSTLAGALAASKMHIPVAHVEAGLRSFNMRMPEEINRILTDRLSNLLFCPTPTAIHNLEAEGITAGLHDVGDVMYDVALFYSERAQRQSTIIERLNLTPGKFILATCHRAENTDDRTRLSEIVRALSELAKDMPVVFPVHPRTRQLAENYAITGQMENLLVTAPLSYLEMIALERAAHVICTDSGGVQKEAYFFGVPCVTMRDETEWVELVDSGWNQLAGADSAHIREAVSRARSLEKEALEAYGDGCAAEKIAQILASS